MRKAADEDADGKKDRTSHQRTLAADEVGCDSGADKSKPEHGSEYTAHHAKLGIGDPKRRKVDFDLRKRGVVYLARCLLKEKGNEQKRQKPPFVASAA